MIQNSPAQAIDTSERIRRVLSDQSAYSEGTVIARRYRVHRVLGRGGFGIVYLVTSLFDGAVFALKTYRDEFLFDENVQRSFEREALVWIGIGQHLFIVQAHHVVRSDNRMFVAMDFIAPDENGLVTLRDHIAHYGALLNPSMIGVWTIQFCHGMEHATTRGVNAHRDIKPINLLIDEGAFLKISDFGLVASLDKSAKLLDPDLRDIFGLSLFRPGKRSLCGTPGYMAPEIWDGHPAGVASDVYSFGVTCWQMAAGTTALPYSVPSGGNTEQFARDLYAQHDRAAILAVLACNS
jgi:serine/threonine protein kinase